MPYVKQEHRPNLDIVVQTMANVGISVNGDLNYVLFAFCKRHINPSNNNYKNYLGELNKAAEEIRRKLLARYEDRKIIENGDVD